MHKIGFVPKIRSFDEDFLSVYENYFEIYLSNPSFIAGNSILHTFLLHNLSDEDFPGGELLGYYYFDQQQQSIAPRVFTIPEMKSGEETDEFIISKAIAPDFLGIGKIPRWARTCAVVFFLRARDGDDIEVHRTYDTEFEVRADLEPQINKAEYVYPVLPSTFGSIIKQGQEVYVTMEQAKGDYRFYVSVDGKIITEIEG